MSGEHRSELLERFLEQLLARNISGTLHTDGPWVLSEMEQAVKDVLDGADPSDAFKLEKRPGPQKGKWTVALAAFIHLQLQDPDATWTSVEDTANDWRKQRGLKPVSLSRLKRIYRDNKQEAFEKITGYGTGRTS